MSTEIIEGNRAIAELVGWVFCESEVHAHGLMKKFGSSLPLNGFEYHTRLDHLLPIVQEIKRMKHDPKECFMGTTLERHIEFSKVTELPIYSPIVQVWSAVVNFAKWYQNKILNNTINHGC